MAEPAKIVDGEVVYSDELYAASEQADRIMDQVPDTARSDVQMGFVTIGVQLMSLQELLEAILLELSEANSSPHEFKITGGETRDHTLGFKTK